MSLATLHPHLLTHPLLQGLSDAGCEGLAGKAQLLSFEPGQPLSEGHVIPSQVLVIHEGTARLLHRQEGRVVTIQKLGPWDVVGLASLLRAAPCETVTASTNLVATAIPDSLVLDFYAGEHGFRSYCDSHLWPAEVLALLQTMQTERDLVEGVRGQIFSKALAEANIHANGTAPPNAENQRWFLSSANSSLALGSAYPTTAPYPEARGPFPLRWIGLPEEVLQSMRPDTPAIQKDTCEPAGVPAPVAAAAQPVASAIDLGQPKSSLELIRASGEVEEVLALFQMLARQMDLPFRRDSIEKVVRDAVRRGQSPNLNLCGQLAAMVGLHAVGAQVPAAVADRLTVPAILSWDDGVALAVASNAAGLRLASPSQGWVQIAPADFASAFPEGISLVQVERTRSTPEQTFGLSWFLPVIQRYRGVLLQVLLASFVVQLFTLANPLLIQVIIDKVISQRSLDTLQVLGMALLVVTVLEGVLSSLRTFLFSDTTNRIDTRLGAEVIDHLLRLPLGYFDRRPVGELSSRVAELEKIRNFLTGQALTTVLDALFSVIYIVVMALYSWLLTIVALFVVPIQVGLTLLGAPLFRRQFRQAAEENARTQSHLVEVLTGIQTVKAQNVEMVSRWKWQDLYQKYIARTFEKTITGTAVNETSQVLQKISQLLVLWIGASMVLNGDLTLGQLIAFRIISGYVTQPLLRLSSIWQNIQELRVSFERLADVVDTPQESDAKDQGKIPLPPLRGHVKYQNVTFRFNPGTAPVLNNVSLDISPGTFVGVVGQSGSGKSTLMKLLPRLYAPEDGRVLIDGYDVNKVELYSLRRQIGIVPQDPLLFAGSVNDNIALSDPEANSDSIVEACRIACAHDFIMDLPAGYNSDVGERGAGLSGGQRQRLAIARTLLNRPRLMVLDEATSALDYDTERRVCENLRHALHDCTVFFITHRLSTIRQADHIVMLDKGAVVEQGTHNDLMALKGRYYALYLQQEGT